MGNKNSQTRDRDDDGKDDTKNVDDTRNVDDSKNVDDEKKLIDLEDSNEIKYDDFNPKKNIGIDFGTHGTAIAYSFPGGNDTYIYTGWNVRSDKGNNKVNKTRTAILLDKDGKFIAFGINALRGYSALDNKDDFYFFDCFKMSLYRMCLYIDILI